MPTRGGVRFKYFLSYARRDTVRLRHVLCSAAAACVLALTGVSASAKTIILVPQDNRPVSLSYTVSTAEKAGYTVLTPPEAYLSGSNYQGAPDRVWTWLSENMSRADAAVLSTDTLIYGGLVDSRKHNDSLSTLMSRENKIRSLHDQFPKVPIYAFGTIMRTPYASGGGVEPYYYAEYGPKIYRISALQDKMDEGSITADETGELLGLKLSIPVEYLQDWFNRRTKNTIINRRLIDDVKNGTFTYFSLGHDDSSRHSQSSLEARYLNQDTKKLPREKYGSFPGADQLALLLIARYHVDSNKLHPTFSVIYPLGSGEDTVPSYESQPIGKTIAEHVEAVGGTMAEKERPDILLAVNTPLASTGESEQFSNFAMMKESTKDFVKRIKSACDRSIPVSVVDVYFANGSDNTIMKLLDENGLLYRLASYNGWNTASNTIGYSIAQAVLAPDMSLQDHRDMLTEQYLDNWGYQANVRKNIYRLQETIRTDRVKYASALPPQMEKEMVAELQVFAKRKLGIDPRTVWARFPWGRLFEIEAVVAPAPKYPIVLTMEEEQKKAAAEAKAKAEAAARAKAKGEALKGTAVTAPPAALPEGAASLPKASPDEAAGTQ